MTRIFLCCALLAMTGCALDSLDDEPLESVAGEESLAITSAEREVGPRLPALMSSVYQDDDGDYFSDRGRIHISRNPGRDLGYEEDLRPLTCWIDEACLTCCEGWVCCAWCEGQWHCG